MNFSELNARTYPNEIQVTTSPKCHYLNYGERKLEVIEICTMSTTCIGSLAVFMDALKKNTDKRELASFKTHFMLFKRDESVDRHIPWIANVNLAFLNMEEVELANKWITERMRMCMPSKGYPIYAKECVFGCPNKKINVTPTIDPQRKTVDVIVQEHVDNLLLYTCESCLKKTHHTMIREELKCLECSFVLDHDYKKRNSETYIEESSLRHYLLSTFATRFYDLAAIIANIQCERILIPGDGIGVGALACEILKRKYVSTDISESCIKMRSPYVTMTIGTASEMEKQYREGDVILISHLLSMDYDLVTRNKGRNIVVYEHETLYKGSSELAQPITNFPYLRVSDLSIWRGIPIKLSLMGRKEPYHPVLTKCCDENKIMVASDNKCIRLLDYYAKNGKKIRIFPLPGQMDKINKSSLQIDLAITADNTLVLYQKNVPVRIDGITMENFQNVQTGERHKLQQFIPAQDWIIGKLTMYECIPAASYECNYGFEALDLIAFKGNNEFHARVMQVKNVRAYIEYYGKIKYRKDFDVADKRKIAAKISAENLIMKNEIETGYFWKFFVKLKKVLLDGASEDTLWEGGTKIGGTLPMDAAYNPFPINISEYGDPPKIYGKDRDFT